MSSFSAAAQTPFSFSTDPTAVRDGDTIDIAYFVTASTALTEISFVHDLEPWQVEAACSPTIDLAGSWFCEDGLCSASYSINDQRDQISVTISRPAGEPLSGSGEVMNLKGITILIDDDWLRLELSQEAPFRVYPNPADQFLFVESESESILPRLLIWNFAGQILVDRQITGGLEKVSVSQLPSGWYWMNLEGPEQSSSPQILQVSH